MSDSEFWRRQPKIAVVAAAIALALGSSAQLREPERENSNRLQTDQSTPDRSTQIARSDTALQTFEQYLQSNTLRVSKLVGMELQSRSGDNLGEVDDIIPSTAPGQDMQLIVQIGDIGSDEKLIAIAFEEIQISADGDELYTNRTREQLAAEPALRLDERPAGRATTLAQRSAADANRDAANRGAAPQPGAETRTTQPATPGGAGQRSTPFTSASPSHRRVADLIGAEVIGGGEKVGEVDDIVISTAGADSVRAVLQVGGVAGMGEKRVSLPLAELIVERSGAGEPTLRVALDGEALQRLPEFEYEAQTAAL